MTPADLDLAPSQTKPCPAAAPGRAYRPVDRRVVTVLGLTVGLVAALGPDAVLSPLVDESGPRALGLVALTLLLAAGWAWSGRRPSFSRRLVIGLGAATLLGGLAVAQLLPTSRELLRSLLIDGTPWPGTLLISLTCSLALAPLALPLGALLGVALAVNDRRSLALYCFGTSLGLALAPHLGEVWLGRAGTLQVSSLCAAAAASALAESAHLTGRQRLPRGALPGLIYVSLITAVCLHLAPPLIDLGPSRSTWLLAALMSGAALGLALPSARPAALIQGLALLGLPPLLGLVQTVTAAGAVGVGSDFMTLSILALPLGLFAGRCLGVTGAGDGPRGWALPVAALVPGACLLMLPLPGMLILALLGLAGVALVLACLSLAGRPRTLGLLGSSAAAFVLASIPLPSALDGLVPDAVQDSRQGQLALVTDPADGSPRLAISGRAALGSSALARRRLVHLPFLLRGHAPRALLVASDLGQAVEAAELHGPEHLDWLRPLPAPWSAPRTTAVGARTTQTNAAHGSERLHLARQLAGYDLMVHLPDPRGRSRAVFTGTREFFAESAAALNEGGLFCQWWDLASVDITDLKGIIGGALGAFEHTYLMIDHPRSRHAAIAILGSHSPLRLQPAAIDRALSERPGVAADWDAVGLDGLLTCCLVVQHSGVLELLAPSERSLGDDRSTLGVRGGLRAMDQPETARLAMESFSERRSNPMPWISVPGQQRIATKEHVRDVQRGWQHLLGGAQDVVATLGTASPPFDTEARGQGPEIERDGFVNALASLADWAYLEQLVIDMAARLERDGRAADAEQYLRQAVHEAPNLPGLRFALASVVERKGDVDDACILYGTVLAFDPDHVAARAAMVRLCGGR